MSLSLNQIAFSIPAGQTQEFGLVADFYRLATFPSGLLVSLNGGPANALTEGFSQQGTPGSGEVRLLRIENPTAGTLAGVFTHGTGEMALPGVTTLSGTIPLPTGASSAALQTSGNTLLAQSVALDTTRNASLQNIVTDLPTRASAANQAATNTKLDAISIFTASTDSNTSSINAGVVALTAAGTETARGTAITNATVAFNGKKSVGVSNRTASTGNVTVTFSDNSTLEILPGESAGWSVTDRLNTLSDLSVTSPDATTTAVVSSTS